MDTSITSSSIGDSQEKKAKKESHFVLQDVRREIKKMARVVLGLGFWALARRVKRERIVLIRLQPIMAVQVEMETIMAKGPRRVVAKLMGSMILTK